MQQKEITKLGQIGVPFFKDKSSVNEYLSLTAFSLLLTIFSLASVYIVREFGLHIPGHRGLILMPLLIIGKTRWKTKASATYMAIFSAITIVGVMPALGNLGGMGISPFIILIVPAIAIDAMWPIADKFHNKRFAYSAIITFIASLAYLSTIPFLMITWHFGFGQYLAAHFAFETVIFMYFIFGAAGGIIGFLTNALRNS